MSKRFHIYRFVCLFLMGMLLAACGPSVEEGATMTAAVWTDTPTATATVTNTPTPTLTPTITPTPTPIGGGRIYYTVFSDDKKSTDLFVMNPDGSGQTHLASISGNVMAPAFSPDRKHVLYNVEQSGNWDLYMMDVDGSNQTQLTNSPPFEYDAIWSPDGTHIAFRNFTGNGYSLYVINSDGSELKLLNSNIYEYVWAPDGERLAFTSITAPPDTFTLYTIDVKGGQPTKLVTGYRAGNTGGFSWSQDGSQIIYVKDNPESLFSTNVTTGETIQLASNLPLDSASCFNYSINISPDNNHAMFGCSDKPVLYVMDIDGNNQKLLTDNIEVDLWGAWSPDRTRLITYASKDKGIAIYMVNVDGSGFTCLSDDAYWNSFWSPDGMHLVFAQQRADDKLAIYITGSDGNELIQLTDYGNYQPFGWLP